jgi:hypothetical protein
MGILGEELGAGLVINHPPTFPLVVLGSTQGPLEFEELFYGSPEARARRYVYR